MTGDGGRTRRADKIIGKAQNGGVLVFGRNGTSWTCLGKQRMRFGTFAMLTRQGLRTGLVGIVIVSALQGNLHAQLETETVPQLRGPETLKLETQEVVIRKGDPLVVSPPETADILQGLIQIGDPSDELLYRRKTEGEFLEQMKTDFVRRHPAETYSIPAPVDDFNRRNADTLGSAWYQNRASGHAQDVRKRGGDMGIRNQRGMLPGGLSEVAIMDQPASLKDVLLKISVELGDDESSFGVVFRAEYPGMSLKAVDQQAVNCFYFARASADAVQIGKSVRGETTIIATAEVEKSRRFQLMARAFQERIEVLRDGIPVLHVIDSSLHGVFTGITGNAANSPVYFDNFAVELYGGEPMPRAFPRISRVFWAPSVRHHPIYMNHVGAERYGHSYGNLVQPFVEQGLFLGDVISIIPRAVIAPPWECRSNVGFHRPGDIVLPYRLSYPGR